MSLLVEYHDELSSLSEEAGVDDEVFLKSQVMIQEINYPDRE